MLSEKDLIGAWRLTAHYYRDDDGSTSAGPMGEHADGLLIYHADAYMSASLMRTASSADAAAYLGSTDDFLSYCGRWHLRGDTVVHQVLIASHARVINTEQIREVTRDGDRLRLLRRLGGPHDHVVMDWRRA